MSRTRITRRSLMKTTAACAAASVVLPRSVLAQDRPRRRPRGFLIGACDWTLGKRTDPEALTVAKRIGLDGVQVDFGGGPDSRTLPLFEESLQKTYLQQSREQRIRIASLAMGNLNNVPYKSDDRAEQWVDKAIDVAAAMRARIILLAFFGKGDLKNDSDGTTATVERLKKVAPKAEKARVTLAIESWLSAEEHLDILKRVNSPAVRIYYDVANSNKMGYPICDEIRTLGARIVQFHAKDYKDLYGKGEIDFPAVRKAFDDIKYRGWFVMEGTKMPLGVEQSCKYDLDYLRTIFPRTAEPNTASS